MDNQSFESLVNAGAFGDPPPVGGTSATSATFAPANQEWDEPIPFNVIDTPNFPTESLPGPLDAFVEHLAESTQTPEEMGGTLALGVLATCFQKKFDVQITPDWKETLSLFTVAIAPPGERKSAVISALTKPIFEYEAEQREFESAEIAQNQAERSLLEKRLEAAKKAAVSPGKGKMVNLDEKRDEVMVLAAQLAEFKDKYPFRLLVDDTTPEKLVDLMDMQGGSISLASSEGSVFDTLGGRYDNKGGLDVYLKGHCGDALSVDRIGRRSNFIKSPRLSMMLTIQPEVLNGLMANTTFRGRGLCGRFLYSLCKSKVGHRETSPSPMPPEVKSAYRDFIRRLLSMQWSGTIHLSPEADEIRKAYQGYVEEKLGDQWESMRDWGSKLTGAMVRIAALIHAAAVNGNPADTPISAEVMAAATGIAEYFSSHAEATYQIMGADADYEDAKYLLRRMVSMGQDEVSKRDLFNICKGHFKRVEAMEPALTTLANMGYVREVTVSTGGRPTTKILLNPKSKSSKSRKSIA